MGIKLQLDDAKRQKGGAFGYLRDEIIRQLLSLGVRGGEPMPSYEDLAAQSGVSRSTVRRAMQSLENEGWLLRDEGRGMRVGPRVVMGSVAIRPNDVVVQRLGLVVMDMGSLASDAVTPRLLAGMDRVADVFNCVVEVIGTESGDLDRLTRRIESQRPDGLVIMPQTPQHHYLIGLAQRLGIPCVVCGFLPEFEMPCVHEDSIYASECAVQILVERGYRRIGYLGEELLTWWCRHRWRGFCSGMKKARLSPGADHILSIWNDCGEAEKQAKVTQWLKDHDFDAVVCGASDAVHYIDRAVRDLDLSVPEDLAVIALDDVPSGQRVGGKDTAWLQFPYYEMGGRAIEVLHLWKKTGRMEITHPLREFTLMEGGSL